MINVGLSTLPSNYSPEKAKNGKHWPYNRDVFRDAVRGQLRTRRPEDRVVRRTAAGSSHQGFRHGERRRGRLLSDKGTAECRNQDSQLQVGEVVHQRGLSD